MTPLLPVALGAIVAGIVSHQGPWQSIGPWATLLWSVALAAFGFVLSALGARVATSRVLHSDARSAEWVFLAAVIGKWPVLLVAYALLLGEGGLVALAREQGLVEGALAIAPWVVTSFAAWLGHDVGESAAIVAAGGVPERPWREVRSKPRRVLLPLAVLLVLATALDCLLGLPAVAAALEAHPRGRSLLGALGVLALFALGPLVLRVLSPSRAIAAPIDVGGERLPRFRLWDMGTPVATASVAGLLPFARTIFVTPRLLAILVPEEGAAVIRHELGHAALGHLTAIGLMASAFLVFLDELSPFLDRTLPETEAALVWLSVLVSAGLAFVFLARRLEHDADLYAARDGRSVAVASALEKVCEANGQPPERGGVRHPSVEKRKALLDRAAREPGFTDARLRASRRLLVFLGAVAVLVLAQAAVRALLECAHGLGG